MQYDILNLNGEKVDTFEVSSDFENILFNPKLVKELIEFHQNNIRQATYGTCNVQDLSFSTRKMHRQKGTGRARVSGKGKNPGHRGGRVAFGPDGRKYVMDMPKKKVRKVLQMCLSAKLKDKSIVFVDNLEMQEIKTKNFLNIVKNLNLTKKVLFVDEEKVESLTKSMKNVFGFDFIKLIGLNTLSILKSNYLVITLNAWKKLEERYEKNR